MSEVTEGIKIIATMLQIELGKSLKKNVNQDRSGLENG